MPARHVGVYRVGCGMNAQALYDQLSRSVDDPQFKGARSADKVSRMETESACQPDALLNCLPALVRKSTR